MPDPASAPVLTKKQQKAAEFKAKKQKEAKQAKGKGKAPALDEGAFVGDEDDEEHAPAAKPAKKEDKKAKAVPGDAEEASAPAAAATTSKSAKAKGKAPAVAATTAEGEVIEAEEAAGAKGKEGAAKKDSKQPAKPKAKPRYILFVGNLPRNSTAPEIAAWFEGQVQVKPSVRLLTSKPAPGAPSGSREGESRGIAFIEFTESAPLNAALALHQTPYPIPGARNGQTKKINVELTAGGGGSGAARKGKIDKRNEVLRKQAGMGGVDGEEEKKARWAREAEEKAAARGKRKRAGAEGGDAAAADKPTFGAGADGARVSGWEDREAKRARGGPEGGARGGRGGGGGSGGRGRGGGRGGRGGGGAGGERRGGAAWTPGTGANFTALG